MRFNKKGQELSTNTVIILVLAVLVLVFIIIGFSIGWNKIFPFINPPNNVKDVSDKCALACSTEDIYGFCTSSRDLKVEQDLEGLGTAFKGTCYDLITVTSLGIKSCSNSNVRCADGYSGLDYAKIACKNAGNVATTKVTYKDVTGTKKDVACPVV